MGAVVVERVQFLLPHERYYQFPALAVVADWVNNYAKRMTSLDPMPSEGREYRLEYWLDMPEADKVWFAEQGLKLNQDDLYFEERPDIVFDFRPGRVELFQLSTRNYAQACAFQCGITPNMITPLRQVRPRSENPCWLWIDGDERTDRALVKVQDDELTGVIGLTGWQTYYASCIGLGVIEVQPRDVASDWMAQWKNPYYRMVLRRLNEVTQIRLAMADLEKLLRQTAKLPNAAEHERKENVQKT